MLHSRLVAMLQNIDQIIGAGRPVAVAVYGPDMEALLVWRMPGVAARIVKMAEAKAYTAAQMRCTTSVLHERLLRERLTLADFMDTGFTSMPGGAPVLAGDGTLIAGIGVSGRYPEEDEQAALRICEVIR